MSVRRAKRVEDFSDRLAIMLHVTKFMNPESMKTRYHASEFTLHINESVLNHLRESYLSFRLRVAKEIKLTGGGEIIFRW